MIPELLKDAPEFVRNNLFYLTRSGSHIYGTNDSNSDEDFVGICIPDEKYIYPGKHGYIQSFDQMPIFEQFINHNCEIDGKIYDVTVYGLPRFFKLCMDGNPNIIELLYTGDEDVLVKTDLSADLKSNAIKFLSKVCITKFMGFARSHKKRIENNSGRQHYIEKYGCDFKDASHLIRSYYECLDIIQRQYIRLKHQSSLIYDIKTGHYSKETILLMAESLENKIRELESECTLPDKPDFTTIKELLEKCLEYKPY